MAEFNYTTGQNPYFDLSDDSKFGKDKSLLGVIINEYYNKFGVCMEYYQTTYDTSYDTVWGEDNNRRYIRKFEFNGYFNLPREDKIWSKFGIEGTDEIIVWVSKRHFKAASMTPTLESYNRPQIGDIIKSEYSTYFYEITEVAEDTGQFLQSNQFIWELHIKPMKDEFITTSPELKDSDINLVTNLDDIFNVSNNVDIEKEDVIYRPKVGEKPKNDPFGNW